MEYLGAHIDSNSCTNNPLDSMYKKCNSKLLMLYKIRSFISNDMVLLISKTLIRPYMDYGDFIIDSDSANKICKLKRLQERIVRLIEYCSVKENREDINVLLTRYIWNC